MIKNPSYNYILIIFFIFVLLGFLIYWLKIGSIDNSKKPAQNQIELLPSTIDINGQKREYLVYTPDIKDKMPLVIVLHGGGGPLGTAELMQERSGWRQKAEKEGFVVVFPQGTLTYPDRPINLESDNDGRNLNIRTWNEGAGISPASKSGVDDIAFVNAIIDDLIAKFNMDDKRIYVTGFSNGATMTFRIGVELSHRISAIAPIAGLLYQDVNNISRPVSLLNVVGVKDRPSLGSLEIPIDNKTTFISDKKPNIMPVMNRVMVWKKQLKCPEDAETEKYENGIYEITFNPCQDGTKVKDIRIDNLSHVYPGLSRLFKEDPKIGDKIHATDVAWDFFKNLSN